MISLVNLQKKVEVDLASVRGFLKTLGQTAAELNGCKFSVALISDDRMKQLNEMFRGKESTTDVLSFPHEPDEFDPVKNNLGDIVISAEQAQKQSRPESGLDGEIKQLILHGLLHLCGYDHETDNGEMNARELELREQLGI